MRARIPVLLLIFAFLGAISTALAQSGDEACAGCHEQARQIQGSPHAALGCTGCHEKHESYPHPANVPKPKCADCHADIAAKHAESVHGQAIKNGNTAAPDCSVCHGSAHEVKFTKSAEFHKGVPEICGMCHSEIAAQFRESVHGKAVAEGIAAAPVCTNCHGEHSILAPKDKASPVNAGHIRETCGQCHGNVQLSRRFGLPEDRLVSFDASYHGLAAKAGSQSVANCASCHGFHDIKASSDPSSSTNPKNLPKTCGQCHPGAGTRFALGPIHQAEAGGKEPEAVKWVRLAYLILIPLTIGYMLLHNLGDWFRKLLKRRFSGRPVRGAAQQGPREVRMYGLERVQHALLASSFIVLAWTGFALKYPDQWWARPLVMWEHYFPVRGVVHRIAAGVFLAAAALHAGSLIASRRLRDHWKEMIPRRNDVPEIVLNFAYNMGLTNRKPRISSHSYIEKMEYWAVIWGGVVMGVTGLLLWGINYALRWLPKSVIDVATSIHFYEAVLATMAIVVWHFYSVIFDPDVYPLETAFLTGVSVKEHGPDGHAGGTPAAGGTHREFADAAEGSEAK
jgi:cytochrome b subunit of formate dehydrogenase